MNKTFRKIVFALVLSILIVPLVSLLEPSKTEASSYSAGNLCTDGAFINVNTLDLNGIQNFLVNKGSYLANYNIEGHSAAWWIWTESRSYGLNPIAVLATLQKEQGLITGYYAQNYSQTRLDWAMGYGYTDSGPLPQYAGFVNQIDYGTWQLRQNFNVWAQNGSVWNVGKSMTIDGQTVNFSNKCTSSLYRYTPHLQGNYNFWNYFNLWGGEGVFDARIIAQGPYYGPGVPGAALVPGQSFTVWASYQNTGNTTWTKDDTITPVHLGTWAPVGRRSAFLGNQDLRGYLAQSTVAPGEIGTFYYTFTAPAREGNYTERFRPVAEYVGWIGQEISWSYTVSRGAAAAQTSAAYITQGPQGGPASYGVPMYPGDRAVLSVTVLNNGSQTWYRTGENAVHLGSYLPRDRFGAFTEGVCGRGMMDQDVVYPGQVATFSLPIVYPSVRSDYIEHYRLVMEGVTWFGPDFSWFIQVR